MYSKEKNKLYFKGDDVKTKGNRILFAYGKWKCRFWYVYSRILLCTIRCKIYSKCNLWIRERKKYCCKWFWIDGYPITYFSCTTESNFQENTGDNDFSKYLFKQTGLLLSEEVATRIEISLKLNNIDNQSVNYQDYKCF